MKHSGCFVIGCGQSAQSFITLSRLSPSYNYYLSSLSASFSSLSFAVSAGELVVVTLDPETP